MNRNFIPSLQIVSAKKFRIKKHFPIFHFAFIAYLSACFLLIGCSGLNNPGNSINIEPGLGKLSNVRLSDLAENIEYIPLETTPEILIDDNSRFIHTEEYIISFDVNNCYVFNPDGSFVGAIGKIGEGPSEYMTPFNGFYSPVNEHVYFPATRNKSIKEFSINGNLIKDVLTPKEDFLQVKNISPFLFAGYRSNINGNAEWNLIVFNQNGDSVFTVPNVYKYNATSYNQFLDEGVFYYFDDHLHFKEIYNDTIFRFSRDGNLKPHYIINSGKYKVPVDIKSDFQNFLKTYANDYFSVNNIMESTSYMMMSYLHSKKNNLIIYNKQTGQVDDFSSNANQKGIPNNWDGGLNFFPASNSGDSFLQVIEAYELKQHISSEAFKNSTPNYPEKKKELERLANSLNENDNPVLMLVKLKE